MWPFSKKRKEKEQVTPRYLDDNLCVPSWVEHEYKGWEPDIPEMLSNLGLVRTHTTIPNIKVHYDASGFTHYRLGVYSVGIHSYVNDITLEFITNYLVVIANKTVYSASVTTKKGKKTYKVHRDWESELYPAQLVWLAEKVSEWAEKAQERKDYLERAKREQAEMKARAMVCGEDVIDNTIAYHRMCRAGLNVFKET